MGRSRVRERGGQENQETAVADPEGLGGLTSPQRFFYFSVWKFLRTCLFEEREGKSWRRKRRRGGGGEGEGQEGQEEEEEEEGEEEEQQQQEEEQQQQQQDEEEEEQQQQQQDEEEEQQQQDEDEEEQQQQQEEEEEEREEDEQQQQQEEEQQQQQQEEEEEQQQQEEEEEQQQQQQQRGRGSDRQDGVSRGEEERPREDRGPSPTLEGGPRHRLALPSVLHLPTPYPVTLNPCLTPASRDRKAPPPGGTMTRNGTGSIKEEAKSDIREGDNFNNHCFPILLRHSLI